MYFRLDNNILILATTQNEHLANFKIIHKVNYQVL